MANGGSVWPPLAGRLCSLSPVKSAQRGKSREKAVSQYLTETEAALLATEQGVPVSPRTLANWRWSGQGPLFVKALRRVRYRREDVLAWASAQISAPRRSTSDAA